MLDAVLGRVGRLVRADRPLTSWELLLLSIYLAAASSGSKGSGSSFPFLIIVVIFGLGFYLLVLRPQRSRARKAQQQQREIEVGTSVMTASGMYGTVAGLEDDAVLLEIAPGVTTRWARAAIGRVVETEEVLGLERLDEPPTRPGDEEPGP